MGFVLLYLVVPGLPMIFCLYPRLARKRRRLREVYSTAQTSDLVGSVPGSTPISNSVHADNDAEVLIKSGPNKHASLVLGDAGGVTPSYFELYNDGYK